MVEEVCKEVGSGYHVKDFKECQLLWTDIMGQYHVVGTLHLYIAKFLAHSKRKEI